jgi:hypothetical protein
MYDLLVEWIVVEQRVESRERDLRLEADIVVLFQYIGSCRLLIFKLTLTPPKTCGLWLGQSNSTGTFGVVSGIQYDRVFNVCVPTNATAIFNK